MSRSLSRLRCQHLIGNRRTGADNFSGDGAGADLLALESVSINIPSFIQGRLEYVSGTALSGLGRAQLVLTHRFWDSAIERFRSILFIGMNPVFWLACLRQKPLVPQHLRCFKRANQGDSIE